MANSSYKGLAQKNSVITCTVLSQQLPRLLEACKGVESINVEMRFRFDEFGRICVSAITRAVLQIECHLCREPVSWQRNVDFDAIVAHDDAQAAEWSSLRARKDGLPDNIIVAAGKDLNVAELIEDELILQLPRQVCFEEECGRRPSMQFHDEATDERSAAEPERPKPFAGLKALIGEGVESTINDSQE